MRALIRKDLVLIQLSPYDAVFHKGKELLQIKWSKEERILTISKDFLMGSMSGIRFKEFCKEPEIRLSDWTEGSASVGFIRKKKFKT